MSGSNSAEIKPTYAEAPIPRVVKVLLTLLLVIIVCFGLSKAVPAIRHALDGNRINSLGAELVAELDSYGPLEPASGHREEYVNRADMFYPISKWYFNGQATYPQEPQDEGATTSESTVQALIAHLEDRGWKVTRTEPTRSGELIEVMLHKNRWSASVWYPSEIDANTSKVDIKFGIESPNTAWF